MEWAELSDLIWSACYEVRVWLWSVLVGLWVSAAHPCTTRCCLYSGQGGHADNNWFYVPVCTVPVEEVVYTDVCWVFVLCVDSLPLFKMNGLFLCIAEYVSAPRWLCINGHPQNNWIFGLFCISSGVKSNSWLVTRLLFKVCVPALQTAAPQGPLMATYIYVRPCHRACYIHSLFGLNKCLIYV